MESVATEVTVLQRRQSVYDTVNKKFKDQDTQQRINVFFAFMFEIYRILMASFLIVFVPQKCGENNCGLTENFHNPKILYKITSIMNGLTLLAFFILYSIEVKRENKLITYLDVNEKNACDNESVGEVLEKLPTDKKNSILSLDKYYQKTSYYAFGFFFVNTILSSFIIFKNYLDNKTLTVFLTNILFMILKLKETYSITNTDKNIFYSAYLTNKVQFNDVDPDKVIQNDEITITERDSSVSESKLEDISLA